MGREGEERWHQPTRWATLTHIHMLCNTIMTRGLWSPPQIYFLSARSNMKALSTPSLSSAGFNWVLPVYHWADGSKQLQTQTVPGTLLRSAWFSDSHTCGALVIYNPNSRGVLPLLTGPTVAYMSDKTLCEQGWFSHLKVICSLIFNVCDGDGRPLWSAI